MIIQQLVLYILLYLHSSLGQPLNVSELSNQYKLTINNASPAEINNLGVVTAGDINDEKNEDVDSLIEKVKEVTNRYKKDVDGTIAEVQQIIEEDYTLPRLTRGEIVEILDNLTKTDIEELVRNKGKGRKEYQRALMLVMPYTFKDSTNLNVEELFTKPPITHIVGSGSDKVVIPKKNVEIVSTVSTVLPTKVEVTPLEESTLRTPNLKKRKRPNVEFGKRVTENNIQKTTEKFTEEKTSETAPTTEDEPKIYVTTLKPKKQFVINKQSSKPDFVISTHRPVYNKPTRYYNHKYPEEPNHFRPSNQHGMRVISPPTITKPNVEEPKYQPKQNYPIRTNKPIRPGTVQSSVYKAPLMTTTRYRYKPTTAYTTTTQAPLLNIDFPEDMKDIVKELELAESIKKNKYSSQYVASETQFKKQPSTENIQEILGLIGETQSTTKMPDINVVADTLTPDMKDLLMQFGLIQDPNAPPVQFEPTQPPFQPETIDIQPISYTKFKPLPDTAPTRDDMFELLSSYGLIGGGRSAKNIKDKAEIQEAEESNEEPVKTLSEVPKIDMEMIPESMHSVLDDIGLTQSRRGKRIEIDEFPKTQEKSHVFNPVESTASIKHLIRLNQLMETLVRLEKLNRTVTEQDFKDTDLANIAEITKLMGSNDKIIPLELQSAPDPIYYDTGVEKNEVKRQETTTVTPEAVVTVTPEPVSSTTTSTTTEEPRNPPISALEESFGGPSDEKVEHETLPPPRKTGFYYLVDWNSFLEVGEEGKNKVNIRFSPHAGDPSRFLKVTVP